MNEKKGREDLFKHLMTVIKVSEEKFKMNNKTDASRLGWGRLLMNCCSAYGKILDNHELSQIQKDLDQIKERLASGYGNKTTGKGIKIH